MANTSERKFKGLTN